MMAEDLLITTVEGPKGTAEIFEVTVPDTGPTIEVEYAVVFGTDRHGFPSLGEAHILANELVGLADASD
jgi:hypothetical protein